MAFLQIKFRCPLCWELEKNKVPKRGHGGGQHGRHDQKKKRKMRIGRPLGASEELIRTSSCHAKWEFGVRAATMCVEYKAPKHLKVSRSESIHAFPAVLSTEGRVVGLCWEKS